MVNKLINSKKAELQEQVWQPVSTIIALIAIVIIIGLIVFILSKLVF